MYYKLSNFSKLNLAIPQTRGGGDSRKSENNSQWLTVILVINSPFQFPTWYHQCETTPDLIDPDFPVLINQSIIIKKIQLKFNLLIVLTCTNSLKEAVHSG